LLAAPAAAQHTSVGAGMESHASFAALAVGPTDAALDRYADALATELVLARRALRVAGRAAAGAGTRALFERADAELDSGLEDRPLTGDLARARALLAEAPAAPPV
jgi:histidine ammonia-lyase